MRCSISIRSGNAKECLLIQLTDHTYGDYSYRNDSIGSNFAALLAG